MMILDDLATVGEWIAVAVVICLGGGAVGISAFLYAGCWTVVIDDNGIGVTGWNEMIEPIQIPWQGIHNVTIGRTPDTRVRALLLDVVCLRD